MQAPLLDVTTPENALLVDLCHQDIPIVSVVDSFVYLYGNCRASFLSPPFVYLSYRTQMDQYVSALVQKRTVLVDQRDWGYPIYVRKLEEIRSRLVHHGFEVTETCGNFVVLSNRPSGERGQEICKQRPRNIS